MNGAGNKVGIETDPESSQEQDCFSCSTVISSKVKADLRQAPSACCVVVVVVVFLFLLISECTAGEKVVPEKEQKSALQHVLKEEFHLKIKKLC